MVGQDFVEVGAVLGVLLEADALSQLRGLVVLLEPARDRALLRGLQRFVRLPVPILYDTAHPTSGSALPAAPGSCSGTTTCSTSFEDKGAASGASRSRICK